MSDSQNITRKLAAIMFTDIVGFTKLSAENEESAFALIEKQRAILKPIVSEFGGDWLKEIGDGLLVSFPSSKRAVNCAIKIQHTVKSIRKLNLRIGIHQGDILVKDGDIFGDDVNVASRIEPFSAVGGVAISQKVQLDISSSPEFKTKFISQPTLKGVKQEVKIYCITSHDLPETEITKVTAKLEKDVRKLWYNQKFIIGTIGLLVIAVMLFIVYENNLLLNKIEINNNSITDIFIVGVQSHKDEIKDTKVFLKASLEAATNVSELDHINFIKIEDNELEKLYSEVLIESTSEFFQKHTLISNQEMKEKLASQGKTMNFNMLPNYFYVQNQSENNLDLNVASKYYSSAYELLGENIMGNNDVIIMINIHAYNISPSVIGNNIIGIIDIIEISNEETTTGDVDHHVNITGLTYITESKSFGDDVTENIRDYIDKFLYSKFPSTVISENNNEVLIMINNLAKPKKFSTFNLKRIYDISDLDKFYKKKINEYDDMFIYCDTTSNDEISKSCDEHLDNKYEMYIFSMDEYNDLLGDTHPVGEASNYILNLPLEIVIKEVFDSTAIGVIENNYYPWFKLESGDQLIIQ